MEVREVLIVEGRTASVNVESESESESGSRKKARDPPGTNERA